MQMPEELIREQQRAVWNQFAPGWKKWDEFTMQFLRPMGAAIVNALDLQATDVILDVATGTGEPGLTIASMVTKGRVVGTDISEGMLETAGEKARHLGLTNYQAQQADVSDLPFADASFDAVSCRMGFMFFPSMGQAAQEMARVLKPGGRLATSVWAGPEQNPWISLLMGTINRTLQLAPPAPDAPGMFRCAKPGLIAGFLREAGLSDVQETVLSGQVTYESPENFWENMTDIAAPVVSALRQTDQATISLIRQEIFTQLQDKFGRGSLSLPFSTLILQGIK